MKSVKQRKTNNLWCHLYIESKKPNRLISTENRLVAATGGGEWWEIGETGEGGNKLVRMSVILIWVMVT